MESVRLDLLAGDLAELYKLRVAASRVIFQVLRDERIIVVHAAGHRSESYRKC